MIPNTDYLDDRLLDCSASISDNSIAVGACDAEYVHIFHLSTGDWHALQHITADGSGR